VSRRPSRFGRDWRQETSSRGTAPGLKCGLCVGKGFSFWPLVLCAEKLSRCIRPRPQKICGPHILKKMRMALPVPHVPPRNPCSSSLSSVQVLRFHPLTRSNRLRLASNWQVLKGERPLPGIQIPVIDSVIRARPARRPICGQLSYLR
jgi:hypothetical protein